MRNTFLILLSIFCLAKTAKTQSLSFQINSIASTPAMTTGSLSFQIDHRANCFFLGNGLSIYKPQSINRTIEEGCKVPIQFGQYGLRIYPHPIGDHPRIQLTKFPIPNEPFTIRCYSIDGKLILEETQTGWALSNGTILNTSKLFSGAYIIQVISENSLDILQVIKQD